MAEIRIKIQDNIKQRADILFAKLGIGLNDAVKMFISQSIDNNGFPFRPHLNIRNEKQPNAETLQAIKDVDNRKDLKEFSNFDDLMKDANIDIE